MRKILFACALALIPSLAVAQTGPAGIGAIPPDRLGGTWPTYTPVASVTTPGATPPTFGTQTGWYQQIGKTVNVSMILRITTNGTGSGYMKATLPVTPNGRWRGGCSGWKGSSSQPLFGFVYGTDNAVSIFAANSAYPGGDGSELWVTCTYEAA